MRKIALLITLLTCFIAGCHAETEAPASAERPTPPDVKKMVAEFSICTNATFLDRKSLGTKRELLLFIDNGLMSVDRLEKFEQELAASGWKSKGKRRVEAAEYPAQQEEVYERDGVEMSYWVGGSMGFQMIGLTLPKQEDPPAG